MQKIYNYESYLIRLSYRILYCQSQLGLWQY